MRMLSAMFGLLASILPNLVFGWLCSFHKDKTPSLFIKFFYLNECLKFAVFVIVFSTFLLWLNLNVKVFFVAFVLSEFARLFYQFFKLSWTTKY